MYFSYKNTLVHYDIKGDFRGLPVLLVHGFTENRRMWKPVYKALSNNLYLIPDLLGHGKSGLTGEVLTMEEQAGMLRALLDFQGITKAVLVGHSMGGYIGLAFAEMFPERTAGLVLLNSHPYADDEAKARARQLAIRKAMTDKTGFLSEAIPGFFAPYNREKYHQEITELIRQAARMPVRGITGALAGMKLRKDRSRLFFDQTDYSTGWIIGRHDPLIDAAAFEKEAARHQYLFFRVLPHGHMSYVENPDELIQALHDFFQTLTA